MPAKKENGTQTQTVTTSTAKKTSTKTGSTKKTTTAKTKSSRTAGKTTKKRKTVAPYKGLSSLQATHKAEQGSGTLVIVESPTKAKSLAGMLGKDYTVVASVGHIIDLPKERISVNIDNDFEPEYAPYAQKEKVIAQIVKAAENSAHVLLASDPDREGEAIAWHLSLLLGLDLQSPRRIRMRQITKDVVLSAVASPEKIDMDLVNAQQARRVLDRIVGYKISPLLWKKVKFMISGGRVQSAALSLLCQREDEIVSFVPTKYWSVWVEAATDDGRTYLMTLERCDGKSLMNGNRSEKIDSQQKAEAYAQILKEHPIQVTDFVKKIGQRKAPAPFKTSTLQQEASRRLRFTPKRTMAVAQGLFEGVQVPSRGTMGLITYMRTDSLRLAPEAVSALRSEIGKMGKEYVPSLPKVYATGKNAQDAHEAIRPTDPALTPAMLKGVLTDEAWKLYDLIWRRTMACQMSEAQVEAITLNAECKNLGLKSTGNHVVFDGWSRLWPLDSKENRLAPIEKNEVLQAQKVNVEAKETHPPARYTEAGLVKAMEEFGIGRPSTYASVISTLGERMYALPNEERRLQPTPLGMTVNKFLTLHFGPDSQSPIVDLGFTAAMEAKLDDVESGKLGWKELLREFWTPFEQTLAAAETAEPMRPPKDFVGEDCPECGAPLVRRVSRYGTFVGCSNYPTCEYIRPNYVGVACPKCGATHGGKVVARKGKRKVFYGCDRYPDCDFVAFNKPSGHQCPQCGAFMMLTGKNSDVESCSSCKFSREVVQDSENEE